MNLSHGSLIVHKSFAKFDTLEKTLSTVLCLMEDTRLCTKQEVIFITFGNLLGITCGIKRGDKGDEVSKRSNGKNFTDNITRLVFETIHDRLGR